MDPGLKESIMGDLRLANAFFDMADRLGPVSIVGPRNPIRAEAMQLGLQLLQIAMKRSKEAMA